MSNIDKKLSDNLDELKKIANTTDNPQMKRAIEKRVSKIENDNTVSK